MIYNNPFAAGVDMTPPQLARAVEQTRNIRYFKESTGDAARVGQIRRLLGDEVTLFNGWDNRVLEHSLLGARGWVAGSANVIPGECVRLYELAVERADLVAARRRYDQLYAFLTLVESSASSFRYGKLGCRKLVRPVGIPRRPLLMPSDEAEIAELRRALEQAVGVLA